MKYIFSLNISKKAFIALLGFLIIQVFLTKIFKPKKGSKSDKILLLEAYIDREWMTSLFDYFVLYYINNNSKLINFLSVFLR